MDIVKKYYAVQNKETKKFLSMGGQYLPKLLSAIIVDDLTVAQGMAAPEEDQIVIIEKRNKVMGVAE